MKTQRGFKTELDLNNKQRTACLRHAGAARFAYNFALRRKIEAFQAGEKVPSAIDLHRELNRLKQTDYPWLYETSKCAPQEALRDLDGPSPTSSAASHSRRPASSPARWATRASSRASGASAASGSPAPSRSLPRHIQLPRLGKLRLKERDYLPVGAHILSATVSERAGRWFVSVRVVIEAPDPTPAAGPAIGVDLGIKTLATCSDGRTFANPRALDQAQQALRRAKWSLARRKQGGSNRDKARRRVARSTTCGQHTQRCGAPGHRSDRGENQARRRAASRDRAGRPECARHGQEQAFGARPQRCGPGRVSATDCLQIGMGWGADVDCTPLLRLQQALFGVPSSQRDAALI